MAGRAGSKAAGSKTDPYQLVTDRIVSALERGVVPWQKPWTAAGRPRSMSSGKAYSGINPLLLGMTAQERGYSSPFWGTYRQIAALGGQVRRGETSTQVVLFKQLEVKDKQAADPEETKRIPLLRAFAVFNADQADNLPQRFYPEPGEERPIASAQTVIDAYIGSANAASLEHDVHGQAYYLPGSDEIHMPPMAEHRTPEDYYSTAFHEITHSTGHASRLARPGITERVQDGHGFGSHPYGKEELAAQMGSSFLLAETGTGTDRVMDNSAAYIGSWLRTIKEDKKMVISAASAASKATDLIMEPARQASRETEAAEPALEVEAAA